jgi:hypothetical protein
MPGFFHFQFFYFCPLLECPFSFPFVVLPVFFFVSCIQATREIGGGLFPFADLVVIVY